MTTATNRAKFGAAAYQGLKGRIPTPFPRAMGPNAMQYLKEVVESGLVVDFNCRFEEAFARKLGVKCCEAWEN